jgi:hypothetical protein
MIPPAAVKAMRAVAPPGALLVPVGAMTPETIPAYRAAGADGFGAGSQLWKPGAPREGLRERAMAYLAAARGESDMKLGVCYYPEHWPEELVGAKTRPPWRGWGSSVFGSVNLPGAAWSRSRAGLSGGGSTAPLRCCTRMAVKLCLARQPPRRRNG